MITYGLDPGTLQSALVMVRRGGPFGIEVLSARTLLNPVLLAELARVQPPAELVVEQVECFGMGVGFEVLETVWWSGRFHEAFPSGSSRYRLPRRAVKLNLCQSMRAKDGNVRQALADRFGGSNAWGVKRAKGPLYGVTGHSLSALAVAVTWLDQHPRVEPGAAQPHIKASCDVGSDIPGGGAV